MITDDKDGWLIGWEHINLDSGLSFTGGPGKLCLHTAEGSRMVSLVNTFKNNPTIVSHFGIDPYAQRKVQFVSVHNSAKALRNKAGGVETNRDMVWQIEIIGFWGDSPDLTEEQLKYIGVCIGEIWLATNKGFKLEMGWKPLVGPEDGYTARETAPQRYSTAEWDGFNGVAGHCNVPENEHTDPGKINMQLVLFHALLRAAQLEGVQIKFPATISGQDYSMYTVTNSVGQEITFRISNQRLVHSWISPSDPKRSPWVEVLTTTPVVNMKPPIVKGAQIWIEVCVRTEQYGDILITAISPFPGAAWEAHGTDQLNAFFKSIQPK